MMITLSPLRWLIEMMPLPTATLMASHGQLPPLILRAAG